MLPAALARFRLGTAVLLLPHRHALVTAKTIATLDVLSGGRVIFGAGVSWLAKEFTVLNAPFNKKGALSNETLAAMKELWTSENLNFAGQFYSFSEVGAEPRSVQKPHPSIWIGGHTDAALRRGVEHGDGWAALVLSPQDFSESLDRLREQADKAGRDLPSITLCISPRGKPLEAIVDDIPRYEEVGATYLYLAFLNFARTFEELIALMERFAREVKLV